MRLSKILAFSIILSILIQPLGLVAPVLAETVEMEYSDPDHLHAPKVVSVCSSALQCASDGYEYDANGNLVDDGERVISWNQDNLPTRIEKDGKVVEFFYDANGRRILKRSGQQTLTYVNKRYQSFTNAQSNLSTTKYYFANGRIALGSSAPSGQLGFIHQDHLGSTVLATDSTSQPLSNSLSYFPYGNNVSMSQSVNVSTKYLYTGQELDDELGLYNYNARLYNPTTGSFISADSVGSGNRFAYAENNPIRFTDPTGLQVPEDAFEEQWRWLVAQQQPNQLPAAPVGEAFLDFALFMKERFGETGVTAELWEPVRPEVEEAFGVEVAEAITRSVASFENLQCVGFARAGLRAMGANLPPLGLETGTLARSLAGLDWHESGDLEQIEVGDVFVYQRKVGDEIREHWALVSGKTGEKITLAEAVGSPFRFGEVAAPAGGIMVDERTVDLSTGEIWGMGAEIIVGYGFYRSEK